MNILIIQILRLGDALQLTPIIEAIKRSVPGARISVLTSLLGKEVFERQEGVDHVFVLHKRELMDLLRSSDPQAPKAALDLVRMDMAPVLSQEWDWVINFSFSIPSALLAFLAHGKRYSGFYATEDRKYLSRDKWFAYCLSAFPNRKYSLFNWVDINRNIVGVKGFTKKPLFPLRDNEIEWADEKLGDFQSNHRDLIGIHPGASGAHKRWPLGNFIRLASKLADEYGYGIIVFGDKSEQDLGKTLKKALPSNVMDMTGRASLPETGALMARCSLVVCNDSGPMHLAAAVGTPIISLFFSTHFMETGPYGENHIVLYPDIECFPCLGTAACPHRKCLESIRVEAVEKVIANWDEIQKGAGVLPSDWDHSVKVNRSRFDPWGYLEWIPAVKRTIEPEALIKLALKSGMLRSFAEEQLAEPEKKRYIMDILKLYLPPRDIETCKSRLQSFRGELADLKLLLLETRALCMELGNWFLSEGPNSDRIRELGERLEEKENDLSEHGLSSPVGLIARLIEIRRNNIDERNFLGLVNQSINLYNESIDLATAMEAEAFSMIELGQSLYAHYLKKNEEPRLSNSVSPGSRPGRKRFQKGNSVIYVTGANAAYFPSLCILLRSFEKTCPREALYVCDFGLSSFQKSFLKGRGCLLERPHQIPEGIHPFYYKACLSRYVKELNPDTIVWIDSDCLVVGPLSVRVEELIQSHTSGTDFLAVSPDGTQSIQYFIKKFKTASPNADGLLRLMKQYSLSLDKPYLNSGVFILRCRSFLEKWTDLVFQEDRQILFEQNIFNFLAYQQPLELDLLDNRIWNVHGFDLNLLRIHGNDHSDKSVTLNGNPVLIVHATSENRDEAFAEKVTVDQDGLKIEGVLKFIKNEDILGLQVQLLSEFLKNNMDLLSGFRDLEAINQTDSCCSTFAAPGFGF